MSAGGGGPSRAVRALRLIFWLAIIGLAVEVRWAGVFRGIETDYTFHPDEPKQVLALSHYLTGSYLWYTGSWFYDGYPYGLNHVDEWILRGAFRVWHGVRLATEPEYQIPEAIERHALLYAARGLRVCYGLLTFALTVAVASLLMRRRSAVRWVGALAALAPLSAEVTHFATGDVGVDLFTMVALFGLASHVRRPRWWKLVAAGAAVGMAFSCKYNGALAGIPVALYIAVRAWRARRLSTLVGEGACASVGAAAGVLAGTPALLIAWARTWQDIALNFDRIRWYRVPPVWREQPLTERIRDSLQDNLPRVGDALGWALLAGAVVGMLVLSWRWWRLGSAAARTRDDQEAAVHVAISCLAPLALTLSLLGKPVVQPFHFSYLVPPAILGVVLAWDATPSQSRRWLRVALGALMIAALAETACKAAWDHAYWRRDDVCAYEDYAATVLRSPARGNPRKGETIRSYRLEPRNRSGFRNRDGFVAVPRGDAWAALGTTPLPTIPYPDPGDWIPLQGPVFPRDDRALRVPGGGEATRRLVADAHPTQLWVGVRSGMWPTHVRLDVAGRRYDVPLAPQDEHIVAVETASGRLGLAGLAADGRWSADLRARAATGDAWITVLRSADEVAAYRLYGPHADAQPPAVTTWSNALSASVSLLSQVRFYDHGTAAPLLLDASSPDFAHLLLSPERNWHLRRVDAMAFARLDQFRVARTALRQQATGTLMLPAGAYRFECDIAGLDADSAVVLRVMDALALTPCQPAELESAVEPGQQTLTLAFTKAFAPHQCRLVISCTRGRVVILGWRLVPDVEPLLTALDTWRGGGAPPAWMHASAPEAPPALRSVPLDSRHGGRVHLQRVRYTPRIVGSGAGVWMDIESSLLREQVSALGEYGVFVHVYDQQERLVCSTGRALTDVIAAHALGAGLVYALPVDALNAGRYTLHVGVWNSVTQRKLSLDSFRPGSRARHHAVEIGELIVDADSAALRDAAP